jgi:ribonuclease VapC
MILDASAIIAILRAEPEAGSAAEAIERAGARRISAVNYFEVAAAIDRARDPVASRRLDELFREGGIAIEPVTEQQARVAREAFRDFGIGSGHRAGLNTGDCFAYALAKSTGEKLLYKSDGFGYTDVAGVRL